MNNANPYQNPYYYDPMLSSPGEQSINPYMTNQLYGTNQTTIGVRANSVFSTTLTGTNNGQVISYEEILVGSIAYTDLIHDVGAGVWNGSLTISFTDQNKMQAPQVLLFTAGNSNDTAFQVPGNYLEFDPIIQAIPGSLEVTGSVSIAARPDAVVLTVKTKSSTNSYYFTVYVLTSNTILH